jgi:hypothetical protein
MKELIVGYHELDPLPENKLKGNMTEAERKAAWDDYANKQRHRGTATDLEKQQPASKIVPGENNNDPVKVIMDVIPSPPAVLSEV